MANVVPYRGVHYNLERIENLSDVVTQPYDKITPEMQKAYYQKSPYNIVRLILGKEEPGNDKEHNKYTRANQYLRDWMRQGVMIRDESPNFYASFQEFNVGDRTFVRKGFVALLDMTDADVKAHEQTLRGPKEDRLKLFRATESFFGHIFILFPDPEKEVLEILNRVAENATPSYQAEAEHSVKHYLWNITQ